MYRRRSAEVLKVIPNNYALTLNYRADINLQLIQGGGAISYLIKYAFKPPKPTDVIMGTREDTESS